MDSITTMPPKTMHSMDWNNTEMGDGGTTPVMNEQMRETAEHVIMCCMLPLNLLGILTNIVNIRVFLQQGIKDDSTNIGFLSLSVFDLLSCAFLIPYNVCYVVIYSMGEEHYTCTAFAMNFLYIHVVFQLCSAWTTVYLSVVRAACVVVPLKVKMLFKPRLTKIVVVFYFFFFSWNQIMYAAFTKLVWIVHPVLNITIAINVGTPFSRSYLYHNSVFSNQVLSIACLIIVTITTSLMSYKLIQVRKWRQKTASTSTGAGKGSNQETSGEDGGGKKQLGSKDIEMIKSVTTVTVIYLACLLMSFIPSSAIVFLPEVSMSGLNRDLFLTLYMIRFFFDSVNSSINFFFYIRISTRYKEAFVASFPRCSCVIP